MTGSFRFVLKNPMLSWIFFYLLGSSRKISDRESTKKILCVFRKCANSLISERINGHFFAINSKFHPFSLLYCLVDSVDIYEDDGPICEEFINEMNLSQKRPSNKDFSN